MRKPNIVKLTLTLYCAEDEVVDIEDLLSDTYNEMDPVACDLHISHEIVKPKDLSEGTAAYFAEYFADLGW